MDMRPIEAAAGRGDYAVVLRLGRIARGWTQAELARRVNMSRTVVSRFETGDRQLRDVEVRLRLAEVLGLPVGLFGLVRPAGLTVGDAAPSMGDDVRRRAFLIAAGAAAALPVGRAAAEEGGPTQVVMRRVERVLIQPDHGDVLDPAVLPEMLGAARADYRATRYVSMADRLGDLVASAEADGDQRYLAQIYQAIANLLCKLPASELEWMAIDRAVRAARLTGEPLLAAESQRLLSTAYRRAGRPGQALDIGVAAAERLRAAGIQYELRTAEILCTASYSAAKAGDRERAIELLREARTLAERARGGGEHWTQFTGPVNVSVYAVSVGTALGDPGMAFAAMREVPLGALASTERRCRFLVDAAAARMAADQPEQAMQTLVCAARIAPQAIVVRPGANVLARELRRTRPELGRSLREVGL
jgi:transcriptional regulator with XRE-family HTH domain